MELDVESSATLGRSEVIRLLSKALGIQLTDVFVGDEAIGKVKVTWADKLRIAQ